jgi:hypothetical protein
MLLEVSLLRELLNYYINYIIYQILFRLVIIVIQVDMVPPIKYVYLR